MFHDRLKNLREKENITREHLAKALDITYSALSKYETGKREPDFVLLQKLATYFNVTTDYLLGVSKYKEPVHREAGISDNKQEEIEFQAFVNDPSLQKWYKELPKSEEEDLQKLRTIWEMIKNDVSK